MAHDDDTPLIDLINARRQAQGGRDIHEVLGECLAQREEESGITARLLGAWERVRPLRETRISDLLDLESAWADRAGLIQEVAFQLGYELGAADARIEADEELLGRARPVAQLICHLVAEQRESETVVLISLLGAARAVLLGQRGHDEDA